jgi:hypothetical protein
VGLAREVMDAQLGRVNPDELAPPLARVREFAVA